MHRATTTDNLEGDGKGDDTLAISEPTGGVQGTGSNNEQVFWRAPSVEMVRAGLRFVDEARWRLGAGGTRVAILLSAPSRIGGIWENNWRKGE